MKRREFIALLGGSAVAPLLVWPLAARAQQAKMPVIGFLSGGWPAPWASFVVAFRGGLKEAGFIEGQNVAIEFRWAAGQDARLPELAADLVRRRVAVIATPDTVREDKPVALVAKAATSEIPIVFATGGDPVALGLVASLNRPGGNVTGIAFQTVELAGKELGLMHEFLPQATHFVAVVNPNSALTDTVVKGLHPAAAALGLQVEIARAGTDREIEAVLASLSQKPGVALLFGPDPSFTSRRAQLVALAERYALPAMYVAREFAEVGGLISYGPDITNAYQETGVYTGRVLKGEKPATLPVAQPTKFELVINLKTAKALGLDVPATVLTRANEVIQ